MEKGKHFVAEDPAVKKRKARRRKAIIIVIILIMAAALAAELFVLRNMTSTDRLFVRGVERGVTSSTEDENGELQLKRKGSITDVTFIEKELAEVESFRNKYYENKELGALAKRYIDDLQKCRNTAKMNDPAEDPDAFWAGFAAPYTDRLICLRSLYTGDFGIENKKEGYSEELDEILFRGWLAERISGLKFSKEEGGDEADVFRATLKNDSGFDIEYLEITVEVFDSNDTLIETANVYQERITKDNTVELSFYCGKGKAASYRIAGADGMIE